MSLADADSRVTYTGAGSTDTYSFSFRVILATDLTLTTNTSGTEATLTYPTDYSVTLDGDNGGSITLTAGNLASGVDLTIQRTPPLSQTLDIKNSGRVNLQSLENGLDKIVMQNQTQQDAIDRSIKIPVSEDPDDFSMTLPAADTRANAYLAFDGTGNLTVTGSVSGGSGSGAEINASDYTGADAGLVIQAAIDAAATGQTVNASNVTGSSAATITLNKKIKLKLGKALTLNGNPGIKVTQGDSAGNGAIIEGSGPRGTVLTGGAGKVAICLEGYDVTVRDLRIQYTTSNASNIAVQVQEGANTNVLRPHLENLDLDGGGDYTAGSGTGITFSICFVGTVEKCFIHGFSEGVKVLDNGGNSSNAVMFAHNRIHDNYLAGIIYENMGDAYAHFNTFEGNGSYGIWIKKGYTFTSVGNHYEQVGPSPLALANVKINGITDASVRTYTFIGDFMSGTSGGYQDIIVGNGTLQYVRVLGGQYGSGFNIGTGQPGAIADLDYLGDGVTGAYSTRTATSWIGSSGQTLTLSGWGGVAIPSTLTNTGAGSVEWFTTIQDLNPGSNSSSTFLGFEAVGRVKSGNVRDFTGLISAATLSGDHLGSGVVTQLRGATITAGVSGTTGIVTTMIGVAAGIQNFSNAATHVTDAISMYVITPVNSGSQVIDTYTGLYITDPYAIANITTKYAMQTAGGKLKFLLAHTTDDFTVVTPNDLTSFVVSGNTDTAAFGQAPDSASKLTVNAIRTATTAWTNITNVLDLNATGNTSASFSGYASSTFIHAANVRNYSGVVTGFSATADHRGTGIVSSLWSNYCNIVGTSSGTITDAEVFRAIVQNVGTGTISSAAAFVAATPVNSGGGAITAYYGMLLFESTVATTNYTMYTTGGLCVFNASQVSTGDLWVAGQVTTYLLYSDASANKVGVGTNTPSYTFDVVGDIHQSGRLLGAKGADVGSANDLTLGADGNFFGITGAVQINAITTSGWTSGSTVTLKFASNPTVKHNTAGGAGTAVILLAGAADFVASANDNLVLQYDGTQWNEIGRTVI